MKILVFSLQLPGADFVEELFPVFALGSLVRAGDLNHDVCCGGFYRRRSRSQVYKFLLIEDLDSLRVPTKSYDEGEW